MSAIRKVAITAAAIAATSGTLYAPVASATPTSASVAADNPDVLGSDELGAVLKQVEVEDRQPDQLRIEMAVLLHGRVVSF